ncbi:electron transport complex subunit RnfC [Oxobacter pfennigii]|uniref:Electron transport complex subunit RnfC n=1 Tax=Oxobacter pfennigii TaxID=36849 RepID=A0A0P8Y9J6_9CLOT|nr:proline reductase-associated electron transfer protein PrdC [Oxobacter pfennigii]KPU43517.1 electron transport complex subunit RnfC [Oxobacter pfennigii]
MNIYKFLLKQHIGAPAVPIVKEGGFVNRGELIAAKALGVSTISANIHSSVRGKVISINEDSIEISADNEADVGNYIKLKSLTPLELVEEAGIVGLGGAGFPTHIKLSNPLKPGGTVILNAVECEPILGHNILMIENKARKVIRGLHIAMEIVQAKQGKVAVKEKHKEAIEALEKAVDDYNIEICPLPDMYPVGEERAIIRELQGQLLNINELPSSANSIVINAETAYRVYEAVDMKKPLIDKSITVAGKLKGASIQIFEDVPIGTKVSTLLENAGGCREDYGELIMGGPFTGKRTTMDCPVVKTTGGILATECFPKGPEKLGLLVCACGADEKRMIEIAKDMGSHVTGIEYCKQAQKVNQAYKCENPGKCPGQAGKVIALKKTGAESLLIGNCTDCTNTVMSCAPQMKLAVYHITDGALRAVNHKLIRRLK